MHIFLTSPLLPQQHFEDFYHFCFVTTGGCGLPDGFVVVPPSAKEIALNSKDDRIKMIKNLFIVSPSIQDMFQV